METPSWMTKMWMDWMGLLMMMMIDKYNVDPGVRWACWSSSKSRGGWEQQQPVAGEQVRDLRHAWSGEYLAPVFLMIMINNHPIDRGREEPTTMCGREQNLSSHVWMRGES